MTALADSDAPAPQADDVDVTTLAYDLVPASRAVVASLAAAVVGTGLGVASLLQLDFLTMDAVLDPFVSPEPFQSLAALALFTGVAAAVQAVVVGLTWRRPTRGDVTNSLLTGASEPVIVVGLMHLAAFVFGAAALLIYPLSTLAAFYVCLPAVMLAVLGVMNLYLRLGLGFAPLSIQDGLLYGLVCGSVGYLGYEYFLGDWAEAMATIEAQVPALTFVLPVVVAAHSVLPFDVANRDELRRIGEIEGIRREAFGSYATVDEMATALTEREATLRERYPYAVDSEIWPQFETLFTNATVVDAFDEYFLAGVRRLDQVERYLDARDEAIAIVGDDAAFGGDPPAEIGTYGDVLAALARSLHPLGYDWQEGEEPVEVFETAVEVGEASDAEARAAASDVLPAGLVPTDGEPLSDEDLDDLSEFLSDLAERGLGPTLDARRRLDEAVADLESQYDEVRDQAPADYEVTLGDHDRDGLEPDPTDVHGYEEAVEAVEECQRWLDLHEKHFVLRERAEAAGAGADADDEFAALVGTLVANLAPRHYDYLRMAEIAQLTLTEAVDLCDETDGAVDADVHLLVEQERRNVETEGPEGASLDAITSMVETLQRETGLAE